MLPPFFNLPPPPDPLKIMPWSWVMPLSPDPEQLPAQTAPVDMAPPSTPAAPYSPPYPPEYFPPPVRPVDRAPEPPAEAALDRPGCTAADNCFLARDHLQGVAERDRDYYLLTARTVPLLREAISAAEQAGGLDEARHLREALPYAEKAALDRDPDAARMAAGLLEEVLPRAWDLGSTCGSQHQNDGDCPHCPSLMTVREFADKYREATS